MLQHFCCLCSKLLGLKEFTQELAYFQQKGALEGSLKERGRDLLHHVLRPAAGHVAG